MRDFLKVVTYLLASAILAAAAAPWLFHAGTTLGNAQESLRVLTQTDFQRYFNRSFLIAAVLLLVPLCFWLRVSNIGELGLERNKKWGSDLLFGLFASLACIWCYGAILLLFGFAEFKDPLPWHRLTAAIGTAAAVALVEEAFFRGALLGLFRRTTGKWTSLVLVSALYSILHFLKPSEGIIPAEEVRWWSGFALIPHAFRQFGDPMLLISGFTTLFLLGWLFGVAVFQTRSLWMAIGLHAGAIFAARSFSILTKREEARLPWVGENLMTGLGPLVVLAILLGICLLATRNRGVERVQ
jgi:membrane protease YdiL (CAAX protease family)